MQDVHLIVVTTSALTREGIEALVAKSEIPIRVLNTLSDPTKVDAFLREHRGDVLLIDDTLPRTLDMGCIIKKLLRHHPGLAIMLMGSCPTARLIQRMLAHGACGFLHKDDDMGAILVNAIMIARSGGTYLSPSASRIAHTHHRRPGALTDRHLDVLHLMARGYEAKEIAAQLSFSLKTVYRIEDSLRHIFDARNNLHLLEIALKSKLLDNTNSSDDTES